MIRSIPFLVCVLCAVAAARAPEEARLTTFEAPHAAPAAVHVNALDLPLPDGSCMTARYEWDFGDPDSAYNRLVGWNAAHVYDKPGNYTITLTITSEAGSVKAYRQTISVRPFAGRTIYVASDGDDSADGATPERAKRTIWRALQLAGDDSRVLLRRGDRFDVGATMVLRQRNLTVGAFGPPLGGAMPKAAVDPPLIRYIGPRRFVPIIQAHARSTNMVIQDVAFDTIFTQDREKSRMPFAVSPAGTNIALRRCAFLNVGDAVNANTRPRGVLMQDCIAPLATGLRGYLAWIEGNDQVYLGNVAYNSTREAVMRIGFSGARRVLISHNRLTNQDRTSEDRLDTAKNALTVHFGSHVYIARNAFFTGPVMIGPLGEGDGFAYRHQSMRMAVFEDNRSHHSPLRVNHGMDQIVIRNNRFWVNNRPAMNVEGYNRQYDRQSKDVTIAHNTALNESARGAFLRAGGKIERISVVNNLYAAPALGPGSDATAIVYVSQSDLNGFSVVRGNVWPVTRPQSFAAGGAFYLWPTWSDPRGYIGLDRWNALGNADDVQVDVALDGSLRPVDARELQRPPAPGVLFDAGGFRRGGERTRAGAWN